MEGAGGAGSLLNDSLQLGSSLLNISTSRQQQQQDILYITDNRVTDSQLTTSLWLNALLGLIFFLSFCVLQRSVFPQHYRFRLVSASVTVKPRELATKGFYSLWAWLWTAWDVNDDEIMRSSGLDAVVMIKALQMGVEIFAPLALVGCAVLLPVHYQFKGRDESTVFNRSQLMQLTIAALPRGSDVMWLHFVLTICYNLWVMWVLSRYFKDFVLVRQHYLSKGDDPNYWMALTQQADAEYVSKKVRKMLAEINQPGSNQPSGGGAQQPPPPELCTSPQPTERASTSTVKQGWLGSMTDKVSRLAQRMSRTNMFSRSSDSYRPYTSEVSPQHSPSGISPDGSEHRITHVNWNAAGSLSGPVRLTAAGIAASASGSDGVPDSSVRNSKDSSEGLGSGPGTAAGSESGTSNAGAILSGGGKRWSSGSSSGTGPAALGSSEGGSVAAGSSRGGADNSSGSESSGGGAMTALDSIGRKLRLSGSKGGRGGGRSSGQQAAGAAAAGAGAGTPPTYQTISELHSMTAQAANSGFPGHFWPPVPKHMRTITEDSLEYRLDASLGASRPSSRGGLAGPVNATRNSSSSGADLSPCSVATRNAHAAALAMAAQAAAGAAAAAAAGNGSTSGLLSTDGSSSSALQCAGASGGSIGAACAPSSLSRTSTVTSTVGLAGGAPLPLLGSAGTQDGLDDRGAATQPAVGSAAASQAPSLAAGIAHHVSREAGHLRASITSLDSIDERSSVGTCIIHHSAPSSPGLEGASTTSSHSCSASPLPDEAAQDSSGQGTARDISFAGSGTAVTLQGPFAEAAMAAAESSGSSGASSEHVFALDAEPLPSVGSGQQLQGDLEATFGPISQEEVTITVVEEPEERKAAGAESVQRRRKQRRGHGHECSVDFSKQNLPDLSNVDVSLLDPDTPEALHSVGSVELGQPHVSAEGVAGNAARWSPFANSDSIASSIAAAGVALVGSNELWGGAEAIAASSRPGSGLPAASMNSKGSQQSSVSAGQRHGGTAAALKQHAQQVTQAQGVQPQQQRTSPQGDWQQQLQQQQAAIAQAGQQPQQQTPSPNQQQQVPSLQGSQHRLSRSQQGSSNGSTSTSTSSRQQRQRVQQSSLHSSSEPSPGSQAGIPPCWSASWQHHQQQQAQQRTVANPNSGSNNNSRALSPVGGSFLTLQTQAVAGAAVGAGQELTPAALAAATGTVAEAAAERLQQMLLEGLDLGACGDELGRRVDQRRVAYHWWKELPTEQLRKCDSLISEQQAWLDVGDRPLLAKPSVRFRKTINTKRVGPDGAEYPISVNAQHYAVLVTDVQPRCPFPEMEEATMLAHKESIYLRAWNWVGSWVDRLTPRPRSWGVGAYRRCSGDAHLATDSWPFGDHTLRTSQEQQLLGLYQHHPGSRLSSDHPPLSVVISAGGMAGTPLSQQRPLRRHSQLASCQASSEGMAGGHGLPSTAGAAAGSANPLARLSQSSHLSHLSLLPDVRPEEQMQYLQQQIQWAMNKLSQDIAAGVLHPRDRDKRMAKILKVQADFQEKLAASERMATISRETSVMLPAVGRTTSHMRLPVSGMAGSGIPSAAGTPGMVSRCSSFRSAGPRCTRGADSAVAGATVGNPDFSCSRAGQMTCGSNAGPSFSLQPTPRSPTPLSMRASSEAGGPGGSKERAADINASTPAVHHQVLQHRLPPTLISSSSLQQRLQRMRVGASARTLGTGPGLDSGDLPLHMFPPSPSPCNSASSSCVLRTEVSGSAGGALGSVLEGHASAPVAGSPSAAAHQPTGNAGPEAAAEGRSGGSSSSLSARRTGVPALLTQQMSGELSAQQQSPDHSAPVDDQPTPAAEAAALPPRYSRQHHPQQQQQQHSPPVSPRPAADPAAAVSRRNSDSTATPPLEGRRDSFDSATSQQSYAARRPVVQFNRPYPPDSPRASAVAGSSALSPRNMLSLTSQGSGSRAVNGVITHGASGRTLKPAAMFGQRAESAGSLPRLPPAIPSSAGGSSTSSMAPTGLQTLSLGSSGGGAPAGSSGGGADLHPMPPPAMPGRAKSGRSATHFERQQFSGHLQRSSPDHLAVIIPPCPQVPPSRSGTPAASAGGMSAAQLMPHTSGCSTTLPPQPWGLPPDAALLNTSFGSSPLGVLGPWGSGSKGFRAATTGGIGCQVAPQQQHSHRWSAGGIAEQRPHLAHGGPAAGYGASRVTSPLLSEPELIPAVTAGLEAGQLGKSPSQTRPGSATEAAAAAYKAAEVAGIGPEVEASDFYYDRLLCDQHGFLPVPPHVQGWARVRWAYRTKELLDLPKRESYDIVSATFSRLFPDDFDRAIPVINHKQVDKLLLQWEAAVAALERAEFKKRRTGREPLRLTGPCGTMFGCCAESIGCSCCSCTVGCFDEAGSNCCLPEGRAVKIIPELQETIQSLEKQIQEARHTAFSSAFTPSWFVLFKSQSAAMMAASTRIYAHDNTKFQVHPAPGPEEVNWQHIWMSGFERDLRTAFIWPLTLAVVLFPITLVTSAASRLEYVFCPHSSGGQGNNAFYWEWYCSGREQGSSLQSFMRAFITGWLPSLLLNLWLAMIMPRLVYLLVQMEGSCFSLSALERRIGAIFFYWDVYNMFLQGTIGSTFFQQVHSIIQSPEKLPTILGAALPDSSNFFMQFIAMRALFLIWLRLCVPHGGVWQNWLHYCCCPSICCSTCNTERDKSLTYGPRTPRYGFEMGHMLLMYLIALAFAIVSPLLLPFSVVWFAFAWLAWRHNLSYVYQRKYESGGMMWIFLFSRIVMCLVIGQLFTFCVLVVRGAYWQAFLIIAFMPALTLRYYRYCQARYAKGVEYGVPLDVAHKAARARVPALAYIPPPLQDRSWGWYPEWQKIWEGWGMPTYAAA